MGSKVHLVRHLEADELHRRYREARDPVERTHLQIIWRLTAGEAAKSVAAATGYTQRWVSVIVGRYDEAGVGGPGDRRRSNPGSRRMLASACRRKGRQTAARRGPQGTPPEGA